MKRCIYCGADNSDERETCEKCNKPLQRVESPDETRRDTNGFDRKDSGVYKKSSVKATVKESDFFKNEQDNICPECGEMMENGVCPDCGYETTKKSTIHSRKVSRDTDTTSFRKETIPPHRKVKAGRFVLTPISEETGEPERELIQFEGNQVVLNRDNTDPRNSTITSNKQATVSFDEGKWHIQDNSEYKTTFVQAANKIELHNGDIILIGNQLYRFDSISY